jgi:PAS domain S-box-containing protein
MSSASQPLQHILLVDDNPVDRQLVIREINREFADVEIFEAADLKTFKEAFATQSFDLVITDYELKWATGIEVLQQVKDRDFMMPVVMFTDSGSQEVAVEAMKAGLDDYVLKSPKHLIRLSQAVRNAWDNSQIRRRAMEMDLRQRFLLNQLDVGVFRASPKGELMEVNEGFLTLLGLSDLETAREYFRQHFAFGEVNRLQGGRNEWEKQLQCTDGETIWVQVNEALTQVNGQTLIDGLIVDITEKKRAALALQQFNTELEARVKERTHQLEDSNRQLQATNEEMELLAYAMSHDLRAPIRQIDGFAGILRDELASIATNSRVQRNLQIIFRLTDQANSMIDGLLDYSRTGRTELNYTTVDMQRIVQGIQQQVERENPERKIVWQVEPLSPVRGDRTMLKRVWQNLLGNAVKYTRNVDPAEIIISSRKEGERIVFSIQDNGAGFDERYADRMFSPFSRLHTTDEFEGNGIGLANVKRILHRHGGDIWAKGKVNEGATFYFRLPTLECH